MRANNSLRDQNAQWSEQKEERLPRMFQFSAYGHLMRLACERGLFVNQLGGERFRVSAKSKNIRGHDVLLRDGSYFDALDLIERTPKCSP